MLVKRSCSRSVLGLLQTHSDCGLLEFWFSTINFFLICTLLVQLQTEMWLPACPGFLCQHTSCNTYPCFLDRLLDQKHPPLVECLTQSTVLFSPLFGFVFIVVTTNQSINNVDRRLVWGLSGLIIRPM